MPGLNVDESTTGGHILKAVGSPLLAEALYSASKLIPSPLKEEHLVSSTLEDDWVMLPPSTVAPTGKNESHTVYSDWITHTRLHGRPYASEPTIDLIGTGADYTVFQHHLGVPALDLVFAKANLSTFQYHTKYDSHAWMAKFGDPNFRRHKAIAQLWGILGVVLAEEKILAFSATSYAKFLQERFDILHSQVPHTISLTPLKDAIKAFTTAATDLDKTAQHLRVVITKLRTSTEGSKKVADLIPYITSVNAKYKALERGLLVQEGLPGRPFFKHVVCFLQLSLPLPPPSSRIHTRNESKRHKTNQCQLFLFSS